MSPGAATAQDEGTRPAVVADPAYRHGMSETTDHGAQGSPEKDPSDWTTGDEPMTGAQASYLQTLAREAGEDVPDGLSKAEASRMIDRLQDRTGRGA